MLQHLEARCDTRPRVLLEASSLLEVGGQLLRLLRLDVELATSRAVRCLLRLAKPSKTPVRCVVFLQTHIPCSPPAETSRFHLRRRWRRVMDSQKRSPRWGCNSGLQLHKKQVFTHSKKDMLDVDILCMSIQPNPAQGTAVLSKRSKEFVRAFFLRANL